MVLSLQILGRARRVRVDPFLGRGHVKVASLPAEGRLFRCGTSHAAIGSARNPQTSLDHPGLVEVGKVDKASVSRHLHGRRVRPWLETRILQGCVIIYTIIPLKYVCLSMLANCMSQFLLDRLWRYIKLFVSTESAASHDFASQSG